MARSDYLNLALTILSLAGQSFLQLHFLTKLFGRTFKPWYFVAYFGFLCITEEFARIWGFPGFLAIGIQLFILFLVNRFWLHSTASVCWVGAILAIYISQLSFGIVNSAEYMFFPSIANSMWLYPMLLGAVLISLFICNACYSLALKYLTFQDLTLTSSATFLLLPALFLFLCELYILRTAYSVSTTVISAQEMAEHGGIFILQLLGLVALLCTLYTYRRLCESIRAQSALQSLEQAVQAQKTYIAEAKERYAQTRAFRHDLKNHLSVLLGLLQQGKLEESKQYIQKLEIVSASLSLSYHSGNPIVDILLSEKLAIAQSHKIKTEVHVHFPKDHGIDELDLCVIFANAMDNAIQACDEVPDEKTICVESKLQGDLCILSFRNTYAAGSVKPMGTGLGNILSVAEKYNGTIHIEELPGLFTLSVLLDISLHTQDMSAQKP